MKPFDDAIFRNIVFVCAVAAEVGIVVAEMEVLSKKFGPGAFPGAESPGLRDIPETVAVSVIVFAGDDFTEGVHGDAFPGTHAREGAGQSDEIFLFVFVASVTRVFRGEAAVQVRSVDGRHVYSLQGEVFDLQFAGQSSDRIEFVLVVAHDDEAHVDEGRWTFLAFSNALEPFDVLDDAFEISAFSVLFVGLLRSAVHGHDEAVQPRVHKLFSAFLRQARISIGTGVDDHAPGFCIGDHAGEVGMEEGLAPSPEDEEQKRIAHFVHEGRECFKGQKGGRSGMGHGRGQAEGTFQIAEIDGFDLGNDRLAQRGSGQKVLVQASLKEIEGLDGRHALHPVREHFEFKFESAPEEEVRNMPRDLVEMKYSHSSAPCMRP